MFDSYKEWVSWPVFRTHLCTIAISLNLNATWRVPRDAYKYGGLSYGILTTVAVVIVALPVTLLQLAVGQLSQQDVAGIWRAVPFFGGIGYLRIIISFLGSAYTAVYLSLTVSYFIYTVTHSIPFPDCIETIIVENEDVYELVANASECLEKTFMSPVSETPEYYLAVALLSTVLWIMGSSVFYSSVKFMKRLFYILPVFIIILSFVVISLIGDREHLSFFTDLEDWSNLSRPYVWQSALVQALWSTQISGGYLISAGDSIYSNTNVKWSAILIVASSVMSIWFWLIFWFCVGSVVPQSSAVAVLLQTYQTALENQERTVCSLLILVILILSGVISLLGLLFPIIQRLRRVGGLRWRLSAFMVALLGAGVSSAVFAGRLLTLELLEDIAVPLLICLATSLEVLVFGFIYGWRNLIEDIEFLTGDELCKYWVRGWWSAVTIILPVVGWWTTDVIIQAGDWSRDPWQAVSVVAAGLFAMVVISLCACIAVSRQVQYDMPGKVKSSFKPSRRWGPRDPITHYYWLARREDINRNQTRTRFNRREFGELSTRPSILTISEQSDINPSDIIDPTKRLNSTSDKGNESPLT